MFQNLLMTALTPLRDTDEMNCWQNRPFTTIWPEGHPVPQNNQPKSTEIRRVIKKKTKRHRTAFTTDQVQILEDSYTRFRYINAESRKKLSQTLKIGERNIKIWFQNRRMKEKKESLASISDSSIDTPCSPMSEFISETSSPQLTTFTESSPSRCSTNAPSSPDVSPETCTNQFQMYDTTASQYHLHNFNECPHPEYQDPTTIVNPESIAYDANKYPTYYYPTLEDYYLRECKQYETTGVQWSASNFDLNYFQ